MNEQSKIYPLFVIGDINGNGFILTGMLWGAFLAKLIDRHLRSSALYLSALSLFSFFGVIPSPFLEGNLVVPWNLTGIAQKIPYPFALAYLFCAAVILLLSVISKSREPRLRDPEQEG